MTRNRLTYCNASVCSVVAVKDIIVIVPKGMFSTYKIDRNLWHMEPLER